MFEYHGWVTIQVSAYEDDETQLRAAYNEISGTVVTRLQGSPGLTDLRYVNGMAQIHFAGFANHRGQQGQEVVEEFHNIGNIAPGSYGLLYIRDDEDPAGHVNEFQVLVMRKGKIFELSDPFLSPCIPTIEDEE